MNRTHVRISVYSIKRTVFAKRFQLNKNVFSVLLSRNLFSKLYFRFHKYHSVCNAYAMTRFAIEFSNVRTVVFIADTVTTAFILSFYISRHTKWCLKRQIRSTLHLRRYNFNSFSLEYLKKSAKYFIRCIIFNRTFIKQYFQSLFGYKTAYRK